MSKFKEGDAVVHRTNGDLEMIVISVYGNEIECRWVDKDGNPKIATYKDYELEESDDSDLEL